MLVALVNPASGLGQGRERIRVVRRIAQELGLRLDVIETTGPRDVVRGARLASERHPDAIVLVGGDGSFGEVARAYRDLPPEGRTPVVVVPAGRGNSMYKALMSDAPWKEYVRRAFQGFYVRPIDAGEVVETGDVWTLGFTAGYIRDSIDATRYFRGLRGRTLYAAAGLFAAARPRPFTVEVAVDGSPVYSGRSILVGIGGGPFRGGRLLLYPTSDLTDGLLDVLVVPEMPARRFGEVLRGAGSGRHVEMPEIRTFRGTQVALTSPEPWRAEMDGTPFRHEGPTITLRALRELVPVAFPSWDWEDVPLGGHVHEATARGPRHHPS